MRTLQFVWLREPKLIDIVVNGEGVPENMLLCNLKGETIPYRLHRTHADDGLFHVEIESESPITLGQGVFILHRQKRYYLYPTVEFLNHFYTPSEPPGVTLEAERAIFRLWSPTSQKVELTLYNKDKKYLYRFPLKRSSGGMWSVSINQTSIPYDSFHRLYYSYQVNSKQNWFTVVDPYALSLSAVKKSYQVPLGVIVDLSQLDTEPSQLSNREILRTPTEFIGYETHVRDLTISPDSPVDQKFKGTYLGVGQLAPYFNQLGVTHLQLMPIQKIHTINELEQKYQDEQTPIDQYNYNWGYDPLHYCSLEGWYSTAPQDPISRIKEFIEMIKQLHQQKVGVIVDVVYNHIYNQNILELVAPGCYLRRKSWGDISYDTGAGATIESRIDMVRRLITHSLKLLQSYGVNGFRFDLLSFLDHKTIRIIREELGEDCILYGEGWDFSDLPPEQAITKYHFPHNIGLGLFNDSARDSFIGHKLDYGIIQGNFNESLKAKSALLGGIKNYIRDYNGDGREDILLGHNNYQFFTEEPIECINFLDVHDGLTLWDKINLTIDGPLLRKEQFFKQALSLLLSSQGRIVLQGGVELQRSKPLYPGDREASRSFNTGKLLERDRQTSFHENSYSSIDATNAFRWGNRESEMWQFVQQLIHLRRANPQSYLSSSLQINQGFRFIERRPPRVRHNIENLNQLPSLTINFINGPQNDTLYVTGEVFPAEKENPLDNPFAINFDNNGNGSIIFSKEEIEEFDNDQWGYEQDLQIKLIHTPGTWDYYKPAYTPLGFNLISLNTIDENFAVTIDLSITDYQSILQFLVEPSLLVYTLTEKSNPTLIVHNLSSNCREIQVEAKKRTPEILNIFTNEKLPLPLEVKGHHSLVLQIDHPVEELFINILKEHPCTME